jgi:hypothetical protein
MKYAWILLMLVACSPIEEEELGPPPTRAESLPVDAVKMTPETDHFPPRLVLRDEFADPIPMPGPVNTAGVEDAPVLSTDGTRFLFFFTPDGNLPAEEQIFDRVTGIWLSRFESSTWSEPERVRLHDEAAGDLALDGPFALQGDTLWFGSFRANTWGDGDIYTALYNGETWVDWENAGREINDVIDVGECWILPGTGELIYDSTREGGLGGQDLWRVWREGEDWSEPENLGAPLNTGLGDSRPCISPDGQVLWFTYEGSVNEGPGPSIWRAHRSGDDWVNPEEVVTGFVGDPGVDADGNLYFTHLFFTPEFEKIETDIYVCYRR